MVTTIVDNESPTTLFCLLVLVMDYIYSLVLIMFLLPSLHIVLLTSYPITTYRPAIMDHSSHFTNICKR